jgi:hypothetical protein
MQVFEAESAEDSESSDGEDEPPALSSGGSDGEDEPPALSSEPSDDSYNSDVSDGYWNGVVMSMCEGYGLVPYETEAEVRIQTPWRETFVRGARDGRRIAVTYDEASTVAELKASVEKDTGIPASVMFLTFAGHILDDSRTLGSYNIDQHADIHLAVRGPGGAKRPRTEPAEEMIDTTPLTSDHELVRRVLTLTEFSLSSHTASLNHEVLMSLNSELATTRHIDRATAIIASYSPGMKDCDEWFLRCKARHTAATAHAAVLTEKAMAESRWHDSVEGFGLAKFKRFIAGLAVAAEAGKEKTSASSTRLAPVPRRARTESDEEEEEVEPAPTARRGGLFRWL